MGSTGPFPPAAATPDYGQNEKACNEMCTCHLKNRYVKMDACAQLVYFRLWPN